MSKRLYTAVVVPQDAIDCNQLATLTLGMPNITDTVPFKAGQQSVVWFALHPVQCISACTPEYHKDTVHISVNELANQLKLWQ